MLPNNEDYELAPENAHPKARTLLRESFYWDCADEESPLGNDNGADVFYLYGEALEAGEDPTGVDFLNRIMEGWGFEFSAWKAGEEQAIVLYEDDEYALEAANDAAIALAFSALVVKGKIPPELNELAGFAVTRELNAELLTRRWRDPEARQTKLISMRRVLAEVRA